MTRERGSTIERVLALVRLIAEADRAMGLLEIGKTLDMPKSTTHRLCAALERQGFLQKEIDGKKYLPGPVLRDVAMGILSGASYRMERHAILESLSEDVGETCNLAYPDGSGMVYADRVETKWPLRLQFPIGSKVPLHCTASGKMYLASLDRRRQRKLLSILPMERLTPLTTIDAEQLLSELAEVRANDYSTDRGELVAGMIAVAVPIRDDGGNLVGTVSLQAPEIRMTLEAAIDYVPRLRRAAADFAELLVTG